MDGTGLDSNFPDAETCHYHHALSAGDWCVVGEVAGVESVPGKTTLVQPGGYVIFTR